MNYLDTITLFINNIGIECIPGAVRSDSFLPGVDIVHGRIVYNTDKLLSPGDLLHEAGHIAMLTPEDRKHVTSPNVNGDLQAGGAEMGAIAWSWAALKHMRLPPEVVFHEGGYKNESDVLIENFSSGHVFGVSLLQWMGMTTEYKAKKNQKEEDCYPVMHCWLRV